jgi:hypothetical protein
MLGKHFTPELHPQLLILSEAYFLPSWPENTPHSGLFGHCAMKQDFCLHFSLLPIHDLSQARTVKSGGME